MIAQIRRAILRRAPFFGARNLAASTAPPSSPMTPPPTRPPSRRFTKQIAEATAVPYRRRPPPPPTTAAHHRRPPPQVPYLVRDCVRVSVEEKPGPVHLELPEDIAALPVAAGTHLFPPHPIRRPVPDDKAIDNAITLLKAAKRPLLCIAAGANRKRVQNMMSQFVDKLGIFAVSTQMGKGVLPERHPQHIGCTALSANDIVHVAVEHADLILNIGHDVVEKPPFFMNPNDTVTGRHRRHRRHRRRHHHHDHHL